MEPDHFDNVVRALFGVSSRRAISRALAGLTVNAFFSSLLGGRVGEAKGHHH